ncbi:MAG: ABC transporter substrate-binding protein [Nostocoides sp.]
MMFPAAAYRIPVLVADEKGYFKDANIELSKVPQPNNMQGVQALISTKSQVGMMSMPTVIQAVLAGSEAKIFCGGLDVLQTTLIAKPGSTLPSTYDGASWDEVVKSFDGKKIGSQTPIGSGFQILLQKALEEAGATNMTFVNIGGANDLALAALNKGTVDVALSSPPGTQSLIVDKSVKRLAYPAEHSKTYGLYGSAYTAPTEWLTSKPGTAKGFCDAIDKSLAYINDPKNTDEVAAIYVKDSGVSKDVATLVVKDTFGDDYSTDLPEERLQETFDTLVKLGVVPSNPGYDAMVAPVQ